MAGLPRYHIGGQTASALLQPVQASLRQLEARTQHYLDRLELQSDSDRAALIAATTALAAARRELERVTGASARG